MTRDGQTRRLGAVRRGVFEFSLAGQSLVYQAQTHGAHPGADAVWRNIVTGAHREFNFDSEGYGVAGAAPHGILVLTGASTPQPHSVLSVFHPDGAVDELDAPFPKRQFFGVSDESRRVVVYDHDTDEHNAAVKVVRFDRPGQAHELETSVYGAHMCTGVTQNYVACQVIPNRVAPTSMYLFSIHGRHQASTTKGCPSTEPGVLAHRATWIVTGRQDCPAGHLWTLNIDGSVSHSARTYAARMPISAFHHIVVASRSKHSLDELSSATAKPRVLIHVR